LQEWSVIQSQDGLLLEMLDAAERRVWYRFSFEKERRIRQGMQQCSTGLRKTSVHAIFLQSSKRQHHMPMQ
jgi:hypothetical protein